MLTVCVGAEEKPVWIQMGQTVLEIGVEASFEMSHSSEVHKEIQTSTNIVPWYTSIYMYLIECKMEC